ADYKLTEDVYNVTGTFHLNFKFTENFINYFTIDFDVCKAKENIYSQYISRKLEKQLRSVSNYPLKCPFKKNYEYYVKGFRVDPSLIPIYLPNVYFLSNTTFFRNLQPIINIVVKGRVLNK
ncbi:hypothetical protein KR215_002082, partial [Drosophila sulfurigaster]